MIGLIMSTYNGEKYIEEQLNSILKQTLTIDHVIIKDDCSTDNTDSIIKSFIKKNNLNWQYVRNELNMGWELNFLAGLKMLDDDYVFFCDQDDIWDIKKVEETIFYFNHSDAEVICTNYHLFYSSNCASKVLEKENKKQIYDDKLVRVCQKKENFYIRRPGCSMCINKKIINEAKKIGLLNIKYPHDAIFWKLALIHNKLYILNKPLLNWRRHANNASTGKKHSFSKRRDAVSSELEFSNILIMAENNSLNLNYHKYVTLRYRFFNSKNIFLWMKLFKYRKFYVSFKSYLGDLILFIRR